MSETEKPSWEWRALAHGLSVQVDQWRAEWAEWRVLAHDLQTANEWLAKRVDELQRQLAQKDRALRTMREVNDYDTKYQLELEAQLATVTQERDALRLRIKTVDAEREQLVEDRRKMSEEYEAWCLEDV